MTTIVMRAAVSAAYHLHTDGFDIEPEVIGQLIASGLLGPGVTGLEEAIRLKVPFVLDAADHRLKYFYRHKRPLHRGLMVERAKKSLRRARERRGQVESPDEVSLEIDAVRIVEYVKEHIAQHGLTVYTQKLAFDPAYPASTSQAVLKGMAQGEFGALTATAAAAGGEIPPLPMTSVASAIAAIAQMPRVIGLGASSLRAWIRDRRPYLG